MKFVKGISLYVIFPLLMLGTGFVAGIEADRFFYPGESYGRMEGKENSPISMQELAKAMDDSPVKTDSDKAEHLSAENIPAEYFPAEYFPYADRNVVSDTVSSGDLAEGSGEVFEAAALSEKLSVDTKYVLEETDTITHAIVETVGKLPPKYIGMDRQQFLSAMESYAAYPPLSEKERGFIGLEVLSFSRERVVIQMNYRYLQPGSSFYLAVQNNELVVYLEDKETVYINTGILLEELPEEVQRQVIQMLFVEDEASLYNLLEAYTS
ncbi:MAG: hypothetical protein NC251_12820 [Lachnoclostridium sp.]|nr:hypothetical protein [Lachnospira sp.]MCM1249297.1 hypothetical protein [Lachnoclostridium sp.]